jgi:hypothetical protein
MSIKNRIRRLANTFWLDIVRLQQKSQQTRLGLRSRNIGCVLDIVVNEGRLRRVVRSFFPKVQLYSLYEVQESFLGGNI